MDGWSSTRSEGIARALDSDSPSSLAVRPGEHDPLTSTAKAPPEVASDYTALAATLGRGRRYRPLFREASRSAITRSAAEGQGFAASTLRYWASRLRPQGGGPPGR
jgi:hypothetical protein